ncbi:MAG: SGNH/GDSL hydrolase family protein, partial [Phycisphaerales bacterium]
MTRQCTSTRRFFGTSPHHGRAVLIGLGALLASGATAAGQEFLRFDEAPYVSALEPERFAAIFVAARTTTIKAALIGDSQETSPGGFGYIYVPRLNYEFYRIYGNAPATPLSSAWVNTGGGQPAADWLIRSQAPFPGFAPSRLSPQQILPNIQGGASSTLGGNNVNDNQLYGGNVLLEPDAADTAAAAAVRGGSYFDTSAGVFIDVFAATNSSSGEVRCSIASAPTHEPSAFLPPLLTIDTSMGLTDPVLGFRSQRLGPFPVAPGGYLQATLSGTDPSALTDILALTFTSAARPEGWVVSSLSAGGYKVSDYLANHSESTPLLAQYHPDVIFLHFGANDAGNGRTPAQFKDDVETLIAHLRAVIGGDLPVIVFSDPYTRNLEPEEAANFDRFAGVAFAISQADPLTCAVNSRLLADDIGWNET